MTKALVDALQLFVDTIHAVEARCMAVDGPVTPTHQEITDDELRRVYRAASIALGSVTRNKPAVPALDAIAIREAFRDDAPSLREDLELCACWLDGSRGSMPTGEGWRLARLIRSLTKPLGVAEVGNG